MQLKFLKKTDNETKMLYYAAKAEKPINQYLNFREVDDIEHIRSLTASVINYIQGEPVMASANGWLISISIADVSWAEFKLQVIYLKKSL